MPNRSRSSTQLSVELLEGRDLLTADPLLSSSVPDLTQATTQQVDSVLELPILSAIDTASWGNVPAGSGDGVTGSLNVHAGSGMGDAILSHNGQWMVSGGRADSLVRITDAQTGQALRSLSGHTSLVLGVAISPDDTTIASVSYDRTLRIWNLQTGALLKTIPIPGLGLGVRFAPTDNNTVLLNAYAGGGGIVKVTISTGATSILPKGPDDPEQGVFLTDQTVAYTGGNYALVYSLPQDRELLRLNHGSYVNCLAASGDGTLLALGGNGSLSLWNPQTGQKIDAIPVMHPSTGSSLSISSLAFTPDKQRLLVGAASGALLEWPLLGGALGPAASHTYGFGAKVISVAPSPTGLSFIAGINVSPSQSSVAAVRIPGLQPQTQRIINTQTVASPAINADNYAAIDAVLSTDGIFDDLATAVAQSLTSNTAKIHELLSDSSTPETIAPLPSGLEHQVAFALSRAEEVEAVLARSLDRLQASRAFVSARLLTEGAVLQTLDELNMLDGQISATTTQKTSLQQAVASLSHALSQGEAAVRSGVTALQNMLTDLGVTSQLLTLQAATAPTLSETQATIAIALPTGGQAKIVTWKGAGTALSGENLSGELSLAGSATTIDLSTSAQRITSVTLRLVTAAPGAPALTVRAFRGSEEIRTVQTASGDTLTLSDSGGITSIIIAHPRTAPGQTSNDFWAWEEKRRTAKDANDVALYQVGSWESELSLYCSQRGITLTSAQQIQIIAETKRWGPETFSITVDHLEVIADSALPQPTSSAPDIFTNPALGALLAQNWRGASVILPDKDGRYPIAHDTTRFERFDVQQGQVWVPQTVKYLDANLALRDVPQEFYRIDNATGGIILTPGAPAVVYVRTLLASGTLNARPQILRTASGSCFEDIVTAEGMQISVQMPRSSSPHAGNLVVLRNAGLAEGTVEVRVVCAGQEVLRSPAVVTKLGETVLNTEFHPGDSGTATIYVTPSSGMTQTFTATYGPATGGGGSREATTTNRITSAITAAKAGSGDHRLVAYAQQGMYANTTVQTIAAAFSTPPQLDPSQVQALVVIGSAQAIKIKSHLTLTDLAQQTGLTKDQILALNPAMRQGGVYAFEVFAGETVNLPSEVMGKVSALVAQVGISTDTPTQTFRDVLGSTSKHTVSVDAQGKADYQAMLALKSGEFASIPFTTTLPRSYINISLPNIQDGLTLTLLKDGIAVPGWQSSRSAGEGLSMSGFLLATGTYTLSIRCDTEGPTPQLYSANLTLSLTPPPTSRILGKVSREGSGEVFDVGMSIAAFDNNGNRYTKDPSTGKELTIDSSKPTWIVVHGRQSNEKSIPINNLARSIYRSIGENEQLLTIDWGQPAANNIPIIGLNGANWIKKVGDWIYNQLQAIGITDPSKVQIVGHSWGTFLGFEIAKHFEQVGKVQGFIALDAAKDLPGVNEYAASQVDFSSVSKNSWAIHSSFFGSDSRTVTANYAINLEFPPSLSEEIMNSIGGTTGFIANEIYQSWMSRHTDAVYLMADFLQQIRDHRANETMQRFSLANLIAGKGLNGTAATGSYDGTLFVHETQATIDGQVVTVPVVDGTNFSSL